MRILASTLVIAFLLTGCLGQDEEYVGDDGVFTFALTEATPAYAMSDEVTLYLVELRVEMPIDAPTAEEMATLMAEAPAPYARRPWVELGDMPMEMDLTIKNLMDETREVTFILNGINEFHEYSPGVQIVDDEAIPEFSQWERTVNIDAHETFSWTVDERELDEVAIDLATVVNGAPNSNQVVHFDNQSGSDPRTDAFIPTVVPGLVGFRLGLMATGASNLVVEASMRVRDDGERLELDPCDPMVTADCDPDDIPWTLPVPMLFVPVSNVMMP